VNFVQAAPKMLYVLEGAQSDYRADRTSSMRERFDVSNLVNARSWPGVDADIGPSGEIASQVRNRFLAFNLIRADFENGAGKVERLTYRTGNAVEELIHLPSSSGRASPSLPNGHGRS
jgi:hypothetical protein